MPISRSIRRNELIRLSSLYRTSAEGPHKFLLALKILENPERCKSTSVLAAYEIELVMKSGKKTCNLRTYPAEV